MRASIARTLPPFALLAALVVAPSARAQLTPAPDLPPGTFHEFRINSITALTVAQQITQPAICPNANACLHKEIRLGVSINFDTGTIAIDARHPVDENYNPVEPGQPGGILFQTQSGPAELRLSPPCVNPDGCTGGQALWIGTIDQGGNISFPSIGLNFELFGVLPISKFDSPMGTGSSFNAADPTVIATGAPLDFATGAVHLAGVDFMPAPIVGTTLQLDRIKGTLVPVPIPPVEVSDLFACQQATEKVAASFGRVKQNGLQTCVDELLACQVGQETGASDPACLTHANQVCNRMVVQAIRAEQALSRKIVRSCKKVGPANIVAIAGGLGFSLDKPQCDRFGIGMSTREDIALCLGKSVGCLMEEVTARLQPRAFQVLSANGYSALVAPQGCVPNLPAGNATGFAAGEVLACQKAIERSGYKYVKTKQFELQECMTANLICHLNFEKTGTLDPDCVSKAGTRCQSALKKIAAAGTRKLIDIQRGCKALDVANIPALTQGLGFSNLNEICQSLTPPVNLTSVDNLASCLDQSINCSVEGIARSMVPRGHEVLHHHNMTDVLAANPCVHPKCGDGILDPGEQCDPLFDPGQKCNPDCTLVVCGDGVKQGTEQCDDGNTVSGDGCSATCTSEPFSCGNGVVEYFAGEVCDDSDTAAGDGCNATCNSNETCGNGVVDTIVGEQCDDGGSQFVASLDGAQETPSVSTAATGSATFTLNGNKTVTYEVTTTGLSGTAAHIHLGAPGVPGAILVTLAGGPTVWSGTSPVLTNDQIAELKAGVLYVNVHTVAHPSGEIRGQIGFTPPVGGDGCSADCRSNETCGNGVIDTVTGETCDDGNTVSGDGCDSSCQLESCTFASSAAPLGTRIFSIDATTGGLFSSITGANFTLGPVAYASEPFEFVAGPTDANGDATVSLANDVTIGLRVSLGGFTQCLRYHAGPIGSLSGSSGSLHCCGGHAVGMSFTRDSNTGGVPPTGAQNNGPSIILHGIGTGRRGDLEMAFTVSESSADANSPSDCGILPESEYGPPRTEYWTSGTASGIVLRARQGGTLNFSHTGQAFDCSQWTVENSVGSINSADLALGATPGLDGAQYRILDDQAGD